MKKFGLVGGTSWHSTVEYYSLINQSVNDRRRGNINPPLRIISLNQHEIHALQQAHDWSRIADIYIQAARELQAADTGMIRSSVTTPAISQTWISVRKVVMMPARPMNSRTPIRLAERRCSLLKA